MNVVPLYIKTEYSMLQSSCRINDLIQKAKNLGYKTLSITDEGNMHGVIKFYQACLKNEIKPLIGLKIIYHFNDKPNSLILYAMNNLGYYHLMKIASRHKINGGWIDFEYLEKTSLGLLAILPTYDNIFDEFDLKSYQAKTQHIRLLESVYDYVYLGVTKLTIDDEKANDIIRFGAQNKFRMVALNPVFYLEKDDLEVYQTVNAIKKGALEPLSAIEQNAYLHEIDELRALFSNDLINNTSEIASRCQVTIKFNEYHLPEYLVSDGDRYLRSLCQKGLKKRLKGKYIKTYQDRLNYELETIKAMGFSHYFLIVWDFILHAKKQGIYVGPGRGSAPASLVSYTLGITEIDPIYHQLLFERFLNKERLTMPDIDIDFPDDERDKVIQYVGQKYGINRVAHICTFGTFALRLAIRDVAKVYRLSDARLKEILKHVGDKKSNLKKITEENPRLQELMATYEDINHVLRLAIKIEGLPKNTSTHAAGIIMTKEDLVNYTPLDQGINGIYQTQYEAEDLEALGLLKIDFLGLRNLTNIKKTITTIKQEYPSFEMPKDYNDIRTYQLLAQGDTNGVFQLESAGMKQLLIDLKVRRFDEIAQAIALYRPGPMAIIPNFIKRKLGKEKVTYPHPDLIPILKDTYGMIVYQDQILLIAWKFAGYTLSQADLLRRAVSKKNRKILEEERNHFVQSSQKLGYELKVAEEIYDYIVEFANYGFNKAHSVAYAVVAYQTAFLKANYPKHYLATLMNGVMGSENALKTYLQEALRKQIKVSPPRINESFDYFVILKDEIIFPLTTILGLDQMKVINIINERSKGSFKNYEDFITRINLFLNPTLIENIIYSGALDCFGLTKKAMIENITLIINRNQYTFIPDLISTNYTTEEFNYGTLLEEEKRVLGINLQYNFFYQYRHLYRNSKLSKIDNIKENQKVDILGILKGVREITTKKGEKMAFGLLQDDSGEIELVIFPKIYEQYYPFVHNQVLEINGRVNLDKGKLKMIVEEIKKR